ncbi:MAG: energy transducer TonB [Bacteroidales bacterium]|nr:energy transducer TonB [Bacteroidales bacterium]
MIDKGDRAGLYTTVIVHLAVLVVLLAFRLGGAVESEQSFILDFSKQEEVERLMQQAEQLRREAEMKAAIKEKLEAQLASAAAPRNIAVDRGQLKDDRGTDADQLYKDAEKLARELGAGYTLPDEDEVALPGKKEEERKKEESKPYNGPSVVSWFLEGRKASRLPIPAYRCMGGGEVTVLIKVDPQGNVIDARIDESVSTNDSCLRNFAVRAARMSRFSASPSAPPRQEGNIVYQFIAQ